MERLKLSYFRSRIDMKKTLRSIGLSCILGVIWPIMPLLGWSHYSLEGNLTSCSIEWSEKSFNVISYNITILICVFIIPVSVIIYCDVNLVMKVKRLLATHKLRKESPQKSRQLRNEMKLTLNLVIFTTGFCLTWIPYGIVSMISALGGSDLIKPLWKLIPALIAKSSLLWIPIFFITTSRSIRKSLAKVFCHSTAQAKTVVRIVHDYEI